MVTVWRAVAAAIAFVIAAGSGVLASMVAADAYLGLWVALGALIVVGAALQGAVTVAESKTKVVASGAGSVAVGGSAQDVRTHVRGFDSLPGEATGQVNASGPGAVGVGGDAVGQVETDALFLDDAEDA